MRKRKYDEAWARGLTTAQLTERLRAVKPLEAVTRKSWLGTMVTTRPAGAKEVCEEAARRLDEEDE